mmetsp:Transcript_48866/g.110902  ORF Transcript_48866/g.110902 Transcript_48866/m.110902 type:complete len:144 (-) Transcript_48866:244-675(-)
MDPLVSFASGKSNTFAKERAEYKQRQAYYKKSKLLRQYQREVKNLEGGAKSKKLNDDEHHEDSRRKKNKTDPFAKEKKLAEESKALKEAARAARAAAEKDREAKINQRKKRSKASAQRDSRGRPLIRNTISGILGKLQKEAQK